MKVRKLARVYAPEAIYTLVELMRKARSEKIRLESANALLDRGLGRSHQAEAPSPDEEEEIEAIQDDALEAFLDS